jgi:MFS family permease
VTIGHPRAAFAHRDFTLLQAARFLTVVGIQMQSVAVGWQVYAITGDPLHLGWVGLSQFLPMMLFALVSGHVADRFDRRRILAICMAVFAAGAGALALLAAQPSLPAIYAVLVLLGTGRAFSGPAGAALLPKLVPARDFQNAVAWSSTTWQIATVTGPALGGGLYAAFGPGSVYLTTTVFCAIGALLVARLSVHDWREPETSPIWQRLSAGLRYVWREKAILGAISLDLFAVLLGGAVALLPAIARDVLEVGPLGLGVLRGAPAAGAALMALGLAYRPLERRAGSVMLGAVAVFGLGTIVLGLSRSFALSLAALIVLGAADMFSVYVRQTLIQLGTPDAMRGRVSAVNLVFIGASNELGEFESGVTAAWLGVMPAIVLGGAGTLVVVAVWALLFPALRRVDRLDRIAPGSV